VYDIETGDIKAYDADQGTFRLIGNGPLPMATPRARYPHA
jgi:carbonic anhydrase